MAQTLGHVTLVVRNYDEAVAFFTHALGFKVIEDTVLSEGKRWVLLASRHVASLGYQRIGEHKYY
jgi:catechol 2,3-dioxygenase-like lactoylglutathione lyase family enzyme